jgi:hypothetical protein
LKHFGFFSAPILDVGLLIIVGVNYEASVQPAHSQAINCSLNVALKCGGKALIDLVDGLSSKSIVLVDVLSILEVGCACRSAFSFFL